MQQEKLALIQEQARTGQGLSGDTDSLRDNRKLPLDHGDNQVWDLSLLMVCVSHATIVL